MPAWYKQNDCPFKRITILRKSLYKQLIPNYLQINWHVEEGLEYLRLHLLFILDFIACIDDYGSISGSVFESAGSDLRNNIHIYVFYKKLINLFLYRQFSKMWLIYLADRRRWQLRQFLGFAGGSEMCSAI